MGPEPQESSNGIQSLDAALRVLKLLAAGHQPMGVAEIARQSQMSVTKVYRYLASFAHAGLVRQVARNGKYDLGEAALELGLAALARDDFVNRASDDLGSLCEESGLTALLSVWGNQGPTVVRWERGAHFVVTTLGLGSTLPLRNSATGRIFLTYAPSGLTQPLLELEKQASGASPLPETLRENVRQAGYAWVFGDLIPGLAALSAPVLDWQGEVQVAVTLIGTQEKITHPESPEVAQLLAFCRKHSRLPGEA